MSSLSQTDLKTLQLSLFELSQRCDGATSYDGQGFNKIDAHPGKRLANKPASHWNDWEVGKAWRLAYKYRKQLATYGFDVTQIPEPPKVERPPRPQQVWNPSEFGDKRPPAGIAKGIASKVTVEKGAFVLTTPYDTDLLACIRRIPQARWDKDKKVWRAEASFQNLEPLVQLITDWPFDIEKGVWQLIESTADDSIEQMKRSSLEDAELDLPGDLGGTPYPFQRAGIAYAIENRYTLFGDDMGLGKSSQSIVSVHMLKGSPCVVMCPASVKLNWAKEILCWLPDANVSVIEGSKGKPGMHSVVTWHGKKDVKVNNWKADWIVINYDLVSRLAEKIKSRGFVSMICDESHYLKNEKSKRGKAALSLSKKCKNVFLLSGTPLKNRHLELLNQLKILGMVGKGKPFGTAWDYKFKYCGATRGPWGWQFDKSTNGEDLNQMLRANCMVRRTKEQVLKDLPAITRTVVPIEISNRAEYDRADTSTFAYIYEQVMNNPEVRQELRAMMMKTPGLKEEFEKLIDNKVHNHAVDKQHSYLRAEHLVKLSLLRQLAAVGKVDEIISWVQDFLESDEKIVLFAVHKSVQHKLVDAFPGCVHVLGSDSAKERQDAVDKFQTDPSVKVIVCSLQAAAEGITLTAASNVAFVQYGWTPAEHDQAEARIHRIGQTAGSVNAWYLTAQDTVEDDMYALIQKKASIVKKALDGLDEGDVWESTKSFVESLYELQNGKSGSS